MTDECRREFEGWALKTYKGTRNGGRGMLKRGTGEYADHYQMGDIEIRWFIWKAAWNRRAEKGVVADEEALERVKKAFQCQWADWTMDTKCYPDAFEVNNKKLCADFINSKFGNNLAKAAIAAMKPPAKG